MCIRDRLKNDTEAVLALITQDHTSILLKHANFFSKDNPKLLLGIAFKRYLDTRDDIDGDLLDKGIGDYEYTVINFIEEAEDLMSKWANDLARQQEIERN